MADSQVCSFILSPLSFLPSPFAFIIPPMSKTITLIIILLVLLTGCNPPADSSTPTQTFTPALPTSTPTPVTPSPTPEPLAASVNGEGISLAEYESDLARLQAALTSTGNTKTPEEQKQLVLDNLIDLTLLAQAAYQSGYTLSDADFETRFSTLVQDSGGADKLSDWMNRNFYTEETLRSALRREYAAAWQRDQIVNAVPTTAEQVHARQILVRDENEAIALVREISAQNGETFDALALDYDPLTGGDLGWFPRGYLTQPEVENVAFSLEPGQYSQVIQTSFGYHILKVIEKDPQRQLSADAYRIYQHNALVQWLQQRRSESAITIFVP
jgi:peptidyl-prolyl cis-trans isomerase C